ncbi:protein rapunzel-like [Polypterus senegalus]|uniref:protein rapunzel-like n=1 Tax=Polypterus senegalus TaxID=55291 RepID=UPI001966AFE3|nr:protein rapunzel-like [Polypterus senegalus]
MSDISKEDIKKLVITALQCVATISSAAAVINPVFGLAGSVIGIFLRSTDNEEINQLRSDFNKIHAGLERVSAETKNITMDIKKGATDSQYFKIEKAIIAQYRALLALIEADPKRRDEKKEQFEKKFMAEKGYQNMNTLYEGVIGKRKLFSEPILDVYLQYSRNNKEIMEGLCTSLTRLFCIGLISTMAYAASIGDDEEGLKEKWTKRMEEVEKRMKEAVHQCQ